MKLSKTNNKKLTLAVTVFLGLLAACTDQKENSNNDSDAKEQKVQSLPTIEKNQTKNAEQNKAADANSKTANLATERKGKPVIYQVFTRLFGNRSTTNKSWGTIEENGVGKFNDFTDDALEGIKEFGVSHIWYTGVPHHAVIRDYSQYGISNDDPDVVKGRAGSPYAIKDYYNVDPDLAVDPANRLQEFKSLIDRTHRHGMSVIIDIVPNHIARNYQSLTMPKGVEDFGAKDDTSVEYAKDNNFYYVVGESFKVPVSEDGYQPLNGEQHPLADGKFEETPAKWTGNGSRKAQPNINDWYETVKVNYGVRPDGSYDFDRLPGDYKNEPYQAHYKFWQGRDVPDSWKKFKEIVTYWTEFGVDGFRYDMAEMVPVEFWSYLNSHIKTLNPKATIVAEVYNPSMYRDFIQLGKMDYLYDKVDLYDTLKLIIQGKSSTSAISPIVEKFSDIDQYLLHFLENHDEQRIASADFAGSAEKGKPAMVVSSLIGKAPTMLFYGQALGEPGDGDAGFGNPTRTSIFDYWGVPTIQRWMNDGKFDGGKLSKREKTLRKFYVDLLSLSAENSVFTGEYAELHSPNAGNTSGYTDKNYAFARFDNNAKVIVVSNFSDEKATKFNLQIPNILAAQWRLMENEYELVDRLNLLNKHQYKLKKINDDYQLPLSLQPLESLVLFLE